MQIYNTKNSYSLNTHSDFQTLDNDRFGFIRRMDNVMSSQPVYQSVIYDRKKGEIEIRVLDEETYDRVCEKCVYKDANGKVKNNIETYWDPGWKTYLRKQAFKWGIDNIEEVIKAQKDAIELRHEECMKQKKLEAKKARSDWKEA